MTRSSAGAQEVSLSAGGSRSSPAEGTPGRPNEFSPPGSCRKGMRQPKYPKVLILSLNRVNAADGSNNSLLLKNLFSGWPRDSLAQIYSGGSNGDGGYWGTYYEINAGDRRFGKTFFRIKRKETEGSPQEPCPGGGTRAFSLARCARDWGRALFLHGGWYELVFALRISRQMRAFIKEFSPDLIFAQGYSLGFSWLPVAIRRFVGAPVCFHTSDDWPGNLYKGQAFSSLMRPLVRYHARRLIANCSLCFGFSPAMCTAYQQRYAKAFHVLMNGDDLERFRQAKPVEKTDPQATRIVYAGSVGHGRGESLLDLCVAVGDLRERGFKIEIYAYALHVTPELALRLRRFDYLRLPEHPKHEELPAHLKAADMLFLPESFDEEEAYSIGFSISSKAQLYMMSERPVLVYSHPLTGISQYAAAEGWGLVLNCRDRVKLGEAVLRLMTDEGLRGHLVERGTEVAKRRHDRDAIARGFEKKVRKVVYGEVT